MNFHERQHPLDIRFAHDAPAPIETPPDVDDEGVVEDLQVAAAGLERALAVHRTVGEQLAKAVCIASKRNPQQIIDEDGTLLWEQIHRLALKQAQRPAPSIVG